MPDSPIMEDAIARIRTHPSSGMEFHGYRVTMAEIAERTLRDARAAILSSPGWSSKTDDEIIDFHALENFIDILVHVPDHIRIPIKGPAIMLTRSISGDYRYSQGREGSFEVAHRHFFLSGTCPGIHPSTDIPAEPDGATERRLISAYDRLAREAIYDVIKPIPSAKQCGMHLSPWGDHGDASIVFDACDGTTFTTMPMISRHAGDSWVEEVAREILATVIALHHEKFYIDQRISDMAGMAKEVGYPHIAPTATLSRVIPSSRLNAKEYVYELSVEYIDQRLRKVKSTFTINHNGHACDQGVARDVRDACAKISSIAKTQAARKRRRVLKLDQFVGDLAARDAMDARYAIKACAEGRDKVPHGPGAYLVKDGLITATIEIAPGITYDQGVLRLTNHEIPVSVLHALAGKPASAVLEHPGLAGVTIKKARILTNETAIYLDVPEKDYHEYADRQH